MNHCEGGCEISFSGQRLLLLPQRVIWWAALQTLLVADVHLGKAATFRALGVPVPSGGTSRDLSRLSELMTRLEAKRLIVLGDLFHAKVGRTPEMIDSVTQWRRTHGAVRMLLVRGNHDRSAGRVPQQWDMEEEDDCFSEAGIQLMHHAPCDPALPSMAGHIHPVVNLFDYDGSVVRAPCFVMDECCLLLPAFGSFTGGGKIDAQPGRKIFIVTQKRVVPMKAPQLQ